MAGERTLKVTILGDADKLRRTFDDVDGHIGRLGGSFTKLAGIATAALGGIAVGGFLKDAISGASDLGETMSKVNVIFGTSADAAMIYGQSMAKAQSAAKDAQEKYQDAVEKSEDKIRDIREAARDRAQAAAEKIADAELRLKDTTVDATERVKDARESAAEVAENVAERIADAEATAAERVENAQERQGEAHERAAEKRQAAADRVIEAEKALADAQAEGAKPETIERLAKRVNDARENQAKVADRTAKDEAKADKDAAKAIEDSRKTVERAKKDGAKAVEDANDRITKAEEAGRRAVEAAEKAVAKARADAAKIHEETAKAEDKVRAALAKQRTEANTAQAEVARLEREMAKARAEAAKGGTEANKQFIAELEKFADSAAQNYGQSKRQALDAAAGFAVFGKAAGLTGGDLVGFSTKLTGLASDMASFANTSPQDAIEALGAALRGESEPIRRYGVMLDDATLKAKAMEMGIYDGRGALTQQQKTMAAYRVILDQTKDAQGDFARTSDGLANQQRILKAEMDNASASIGERFLPIAKGLVSAGSELMAAWDADGFRGVFAKVQEVWGEVWPGIKQKLGDLLTGLVAWYRDTYLPWLAETGPKILAALGDMLVAIGKWVIENGPTILRQLGEWTLKFVQWAADVVPPLLRKLGELLGRMLQWISDNREEIFDKLSEWTGKFIEWVADLLGKLLQKLPGITGAIIKWIADNGPTILAELAKWTASFLLFVAELAIKLIAELATKVLPPLLKWIADTALEIGKTLVKWTGEFVGWVAGLPAAMLVGMANLISWIGDQAANLPGQLAHWTTEFVAWVGRLGPAAAGALAQAAQDVGQMIVDWVKDHINPANWFGSSGGIGGGGKGVSQSGAKIRFDNGQWVYDGGPKDGRSVPQSDLSSAQIGASAGPSSPSVANAPPAGAQWDPSRGWILPSGEVWSGTGNAIVSGAWDAIGGIFGGDYTGLDDDLTPASPAEMNLSSNAIKLRREIQSSFKGYSSIGGYAYRTMADGKTLSDHATGHALDIMMPKLHDPLGYKIAAWAISQPESKYVIWDNEIWSKSKASQGWRDYATSGSVGKANQGSARGRHEDHVHISVLGSGGIVRARRGGTLALLGEAGQDEAVVPLPVGRETGFGNVYVTVHVHGNVMRERDLALTVRDALLQAKREGVTIGLS